MGNTTIIKSQKVYLIQNRKGKGYWFPMNKYQSKKSLEQQEPTKKEEIQVYH